MHRWDVYRGQRTAGNRYLPTILLVLILLIVLAFVALFFTLPGYLVYTRDGVSLDLPFLGEWEDAAEPLAAGDPGGDAAAEPAAEVTPTPDYSGVVAELITREPDYASLAYADGAGLDIVQSIYVPYEKVNSDGLTTAVAAARQNDLKALTLELRDESGIVLWASGTEMAEGYGLNGTQDVTASVKDLKEQGFTLTAVISCCVDNTLAARNAPATLKNAGGFPYSDNTGSWMDPWSADVRELAIELTSELMRMGFDEVVLDRVEHPNAEVGYSRTMSGSLTRVACVTSFAIAVREGVQDVMDETGAKLSVMMNPDALNRTGFDNGQNISYLLKVFDRVWEFTETYTEASQVVALGIDSTERFVPVISWVFPGASWSRNISEAKY